MGEKIIEAPENFLEDFNKGNQAQLRCGKNKKYTKIIGDKVYKGPYKLDEVKLFQNVVFTFLLNYIEGPILNIEMEQKS